MKRLIIPLLLAVITLVALLLSSPLSAEPAEPQEGYAYGGGK